VRTRLIVLIVFSRMLGCSDVEIRGGELWDQGGRRQGDGESTSLLKLGLRKE
jgi:hypothetical protein